MIMDRQEIWKNTLKELYGSGGAKKILARLSLESIGKAPRTVLWDESSMALITYGDSIGSTGQLPLVSLTSFLQRELEGTLPWVHLLPFFPFTSDDGFSVSDYRQVRPDLGSWREIESMKDSFLLFFDAVINHTSVSHPWFIGWKKGDPAYDSFYLALPKETDISAVIRPRTHPLLTPFETSEGEKWVWTTFSEDQADLDFSSPEVFIALAELLRFYAEKGATGIRLDAIGHGWKDPERSSLNLPEAHQWIVAMRSYLELVGADVMLLSETNVPQIENLLYFGDREPEAHLIYNFALSGLVAHGFLTESAKALGGYLQTLSVPREDTGYFHVLATHDGIGVRPLIGILPKEEIEQLAEATIARGGAVNFKINADGSRSPYELNITYYSMLKTPGEPEAWAENKFRSAHMILLSLAGIPGIYYHSLFASENQLDEKERTGMNRSINRKAISMPLSKRQGQWLDMMKELFQVRAQHAAFHPDGGQEIFCSNSLIQIKRSAMDGSGSVSCLINMTHHVQSIPEKQVGYDIWTEEEVRQLMPFEGRWLKKRQEGI
jgi:sucrose phosphorylase